MILETVEVTMKKKKNARRAADRGPGSEVVMHLGLTKRQQEMDAWQYRRQV